MFEHLLDVYGCSCGKSHSLVTRDFVVERDALAKLPAVLQKQNIADKPLAVYDMNTYTAAHAALERYLPGVDTLILEGDNIHADEVQVEAVAGAAPGHSALLAVGSGVINDTVRYVANKQDIPAVSVPTAASVDGFVSNSSAVTFKGAKRTIPTVAPTAVVADLDIISQAPMNLTASGVGDMLSKYISIADWHIGQLITGEYYCPYVANLEIEAVNMILSVIDGIEARDPDSIGKLVEGLLLSGIAMQMVQITRPASSFEHHFSHFLEVVPIGDNIDQNASHGEKVGIASIIAAKYYPIFARRLARIFEENLPNKFSMERVKAYYSAYPPGLLEMIEEENSPTVTASLDVGMLQENFSRVLQIADHVPSADKMRDTLITVGGLTDYRMIGMTPEQFRETMEKCCYIRNRFTMLRLMCDYELFDFSAMED